MLETIAFLASSRVKKVHIDAEMSTYKSDMRLGRLSWNDLTRYMTKEDEYCISAVVSWQEE